MESAAEIKEVRMVPVSFIRGVFQSGSLHRAKLIFKNEEGGYQLIIETPQTQLLVARRDGDAPRVWRSVERAISFIKENFGSISEILLVYKE